MIRIFRSALSYQRNLAAFPITRNYSFTSDISLKSLYPNSKQELYTPSLPPQTPDQKFNGYIPMNKLSITYSHSSGPGGQNVNKLDTKVDLRFHVKTADWIPEEVRERMLVQYKNQINKEGFFVIKSDITRYQRMNLADALERVRNIIRKLESEMVKKEVSPEKMVVIRKRHEKAARERLFMKRARATIKNDRQVG